MLIVTIRTDQPQAEVGLFDGDKQLGYTKWEANRALSTTLHRKVQDLLDAEHKTLQDVQGIVCFKGPGSFTGLRIGLTVADAAAYGLDIPIVSATGDDWLAAGRKRLQAGENESIALPLYGAPVNITPPRR